MATNTRQMRPGITSLFINITGITSHVVKKTSQLNFSVIQKFLKIKVCFVLVSLVFFFLSRYLIFCYQDIVICTRLT